MKATNSEDLDGRRLAAQALCARGVRLRGLTVGVRRIALAGFVVVSLLGVPLAAGATLTGASAQVETNPTAVSPGSSLSAAPRATPACTSPCTGANLAIILVQSSGHSLGTTFSQMANIFVPTVNNWYHTVSYRAFAWGTVHLTSVLNVSEPSPCTSQGIWSAGLNAVGSSFNPASWTTIVVVYPHTWCSLTGQSDGHFVSLSDSQVVHTATPSAEQYYYSIQELGHTIFGGNHANSLDCATAFSTSCIGGAKTKTNPYPCVNGGYQLPAICEYGDPWDAMGDDFPGRRVPAAEFPGPTYVDGEAWPNGVEMDHVGWVSSRKTNANIAAGASQSFSISPLEEQAPATHQIVWLPPEASGDPWVEIEYRNPPTGTSPWTDGYLLNGWSTNASSITKGVLIHLGTGTLGGGSLSALLDTTPNSNPLSLCAGTWYQHAFCDFYDAALTPGRTLSIGQYRITVVSTGATGSSTALAQVRVARCPCATGANLLANWSFENNPSNPAPWATFNPPSGTTYRSLYSGGAKDGSWYLEAATTASGGSVFQDVNQTPQAGTHYQYCAWLRSSSTTSPFSGTIALWETGGSAASINTNTTFSVGHTWTHVCTPELTGQAGHGYTRVQIYLGTTTYAVNLDMDAESLFTLNS
jgi:hypothetical protein